MGSYKDYYKSRALLRTFLYIVKTHWFDPKGNYPERLSREIGISIGSISSQLKILTNKGNTKKVGSTRPQYYEPDFDKIYDEFLKLYENHVIDFANELWKMEKAFDQKEISQIIEGVKKTREIRETIESWFISATDDVLINHYSKENFDTVFTMTIPEEFCRIMDRLKWKIKTKEGKNFLDLMKKFELRTPFAADFI